MPTITSLALLITWLLVADLTPEELIGRLGSPDRVVREEAARTLEELGNEALPPLRAAREAAGDRDQAARDRLAAVIARVESRLLDQPTMVALDVVDRPLGEAVEGLSARTGFALALDDPALAVRRVTARAEGALPFWEAVDRLGRAGHVRHDPGPRRDANGSDPQAALIRLVDGEPPAYIAYSGPLRIHLFATHRHRDLSFETGTGGHAPVLPASGRATVEVQAFAEPGRFLDPVGLPRLEAIDEQGRAFPSRPSGGGEVPGPSEHSWLIPGRLSLLHWHVPLGLPDPAPRSPLKLRGVLPMVISARRPGPLEIPLTGAAGKTFQHEGMSVRVESIATRAVRTTAVALVLSQEDGPPGRGSGRGPASTGPEADRVTEFVANRLEFEDDGGRPMAMLLVGHPSPDTNGALRVQPLVSGPTPPARLRVYRLNSLATEIPFEMGGVPAP
jgi:hypothetical protein